MGIYTNKVAVITGSGSGIGRALALQLAQAGARLALSDVNAAGLAETQRLCSAAGATDVRGYAVNVAMQDEVFAHAEAVQRDFGTAHFVFNNAGVTLGATIAHATMEEIEWQVGINLWGVVYGTKAFLPMMLKQREGCIINISSVYGLVGGLGQGVYALSKFGVRGWTESLWAELEGTGVRAVSVHPGGIKTNIDKAARFGQFADETEKALQPRIEKILRTPPEECAADILRGVAVGKRRILTGHGARLIDTLARVLAGRYTGLLRKLTGM